LQLPPDVGDPNYLEATDTCIWIERWIDNLKSDLLGARNTLQHRSKVNFYTDAINTGGSRSEFTTFYGSRLHSSRNSLFHWPSSTRAELVVILLALLASPCASTVLMHTESSIIQSINNIQHLSSKKWLKRNTFYSLKNNDGSTESTCGIIEWDITCRFLGSLSALDGCDSIAKQITSASHRSSKFIADNMAI
ncbi:18209_t:CDS:2, partial [Rhizophagus irregularis]